MTLISHFWTSKLNIISGEGRIINQSQEVVNDDRKKIFAKENYFIAFHGCCDFNGTSVPAIINEFLENYTELEPMKIAEDLKNHLIKLNPNLETSFILGGQYQNKVFSFYCSIKDNEIKTDHLITPTYRFNAESEEHYWQIEELMKSSFKNTFGQEFCIDEFFETQPEDQIISFLTDFHNNVSLSANPSNGIGMNTDIGIVRDGQFKWLVQNNNRIDL